MHVQHTTLQLDNNEYNNIVTWLRSRMYTTKPWFFSTMLPSISAWEFRNKHVWLACMHKLKCSHYVIQSSESVLMMLITKHRQFDFQKTKLWPHKKLMLMNVDVAPHFWIANWEISEQMQCGLFGVWTLVHMYSDQILTLVKIMTSVSLRQKHPKRPLSLPGQQVRYRPKEKVSRLALSSQHFPSHLPGSLTRVPSRDYINLEPSIRIFNSDEVVLLVGDLSFQYEDPPWRLL